MHNGSRQTIRLVAAAVAIAGALSIWATPPVNAQADKPAAEAPADTDNQRRLVIRFATEGDYPPFNYYDDEGVLTGFNVDLARAICLEVGAACDLKVETWDNLLPALKRGEADAVIAGHMVTSALIQDVEFSDRYLHTPGRFAGRLDSPKSDMTPDALDGVRIGVAKGTTHEAYIKTFFRDSRITPYENADLAREALQQGKVDFIFDDGIGLAFWIGGTLSRRCCEFKGGAYFEPKFFGDGLAIAVPRNDPNLKAAINTALKQIRLNGRFEELIERYFPNKIY